MGKQENQKKVEKKKRRGVKIPVLISLEMACMAHCWYFLTELTEIFIW